MQEDESVSFTDGSGLYYGMDVFHQLHCLNYLRQKTVMYNHLYTGVDLDEDVPEIYHLRK